MTRPEVARVVTTIELLEDSCFRMRQELHAAERERDALEARWQKAIAIIDNYSDIEDGVDGPRPNMAMTILGELEGL